jgi:DNA-binding XRE family transcriptional regulator
MARSASISLTISHQRDILADVMTTKRRNSDFLDELIEEGESKHPGFTLLVDAALERRRLLRELAEGRVELGLSQTAVAAEMKTSQSAVARIESGNADVKMSTVERYAATLGRKVAWRIEPASSRADVRVTRRVAAKAMAASRGKRAAARKRV